jgi:cell wall assembly regulator SMI1
MSDESESQHIQTAYQAVAKLERYLQKRKIFLSSELRDCLIKCSDEEYTARIDGLKFQLLDAAGIIHEMKKGGEVNDEVDQVTTDGRIYIPNGWQRTKWLPIGWRSNGSLMFIDYDPAEKGHVGQVCFNDSEGGFEVLADTLQEFFQNAVMKCN